MKISKVRDSRTIPNLHENCIKRQTPQFFIASSLHNLKAIKLIEAFPLPSNPDRTIGIAIATPCEKYKHDHVCIVLHSSGNIVARCGECDFPRHHIGLRGAICLKGAWEEVRRSRMGKGDLNFPSPLRSRAQTFCTPSHARAMGSEKSDLTKLNKGGAA